MSFDGRGAPPSSDTPQVLFDALNTRRLQVSIETHGEVSISCCCRSQQESSWILKPLLAGCVAAAFEKNFKFLKPSDEIKFVIASS